MRRVLTDATLLHYYRGVHIVDSIIKKIRKRGFRMTKIRVAIVSILAECSRPWSAREVRVALVKQCVTANKTTIYRELAFLAHENIVTEVQLNERTKRYEIISSGHHHHLVCVKCSAVEDVEMRGDLAVKERTIARATGFTSLRHALEFFGTCPKCR